MRYLTGGRPTPREEIEQDILPAWLSYYERFEGYGLWAAIERSSGEFVGWFHFRPLRDTPLDEPELGYRLKKPAWGKGYAPEGSRALIRYEFENLPITRVYARTLTVNTRLAASHGKGRSEVCAHVLRRLARRDPWR
jgi:RimJ/RimL family protein N-acetyltransferase